MKKYFKRKNFLFALIFGAACFVFLGLSSFWKVPDLEYLNQSTMAEEDGAKPVSHINAHPLHIKTPDPVRGIYMSSWVASTHDWRNELVDLVDSTELNSIVIDVKDYTGVISFEKRVPDMKEFLDYLHSKNIYAIARIAVFQDQSLAKERPDLAVKRGDGKTVWKDQKGIRWLDPCSKEVWDYTVKIGKEAEKIGFDELNFDYIRFPSDGNMKDISYNFCEKNISKSDALEKFFKYLSENFKDSKIPLSADLFGMVTTNTDDLNIGQVLEKAAPYFAYICPMVYPSHYPPTYDGYKNPADHPYEIISHAMASSSERLLLISPVSAKLRPWLQDFDLGATYDASMIRKEKQAVYDAGLKSWLMWDPANKYTRQALD
jgi:hypothetical protein